MNCGGLGSASGPGALALRPEVRLALEQSCLCSQLHAGQSRAVFALRTSALLARGALFLSGEVAPGRTTTLGAGVFMGTTTSYSFRARRIS